MVLASIVLPTFNGAKYLVQAIESCLNQTHTNFELIIVNDHSTDGTSAIINKYAESDSRIRIINNNVNYKLPGSLNIGFAEAKGEYLTWTSDDNYFAPHALETLIGELEKDKSADIVYSSYQFIDEHDKMLETFGGEPENLIFKCVIGACFLYRKQVHDQLQGFDETKFRMEDMDFWLRAATRFKFKFIDGRDLYFYRKHSNSLTHEIYSTADIYSQYRINYQISFTAFFKEGLDLTLSKEELDIHSELFFEDLIQLKKRDFDLSAKVMNYLNFLEKLMKQDWKTLWFNQEKVLAILAEKRQRVIDLVINDLVFENKILTNKNPKIAAHLRKPISWYYREYEVLPTWYKRIGHIIKVLQKNKPARSLFTKAG